MTLYISTVNSHPIIWCFYLITGDSQNESVKPDRKRSHPSSHKKNSGTTAAAKRRKFSDISETISSSSDESGNESENKASNHEKTVSSEQHKYVTTPQYRNE